MAWGIYCPVDKTHGKLVPPSGPRGRWWCPHSAHGGNGKFFTDKEAHGEYSLKEADMSVVYESAARDVIAGKATLDQAVKATAEQTHLPTSQVREAISIMIETIEEKDNDMAQKKAAASAAKQKSQAAQKAGERRRKEHVDGPTFKALLDEYGLTNKQAAEATGSYEDPKTGKLMGASATYIYIVTHSGSSVDLFANFKAAIAAYVKANKIKRVKVADAGEVVEVEPEEDPLDEQAANAEADEAAALAEAALAEA